MTDIIRTVRALNARHDRRRRRVYIGSAIGVLLFVGTNGLLLVHGRWSLLFLSLTITASVLAAGVPLEVPLLRAGCVRSSLDKWDVAIDGSEAMFATEEGEFRVPLGQMRGAKYVFHGSIDGLRAVSDALHLEIDQVGTLVIPQTALGFDELLKWFRDRDLLVRREVCPDK